MRTRVAAAGVLALILAGGVSAATRHTAAATATVTVKLPVANRQVFGIITLRGTGRTRAPGPLLKITGARDRSLPAGIRAGAGVAATSVSGRVRTWVVAFAINNLGGAAVHSLQSAGDGPAALPLKLSTSGAAGISEDARGWPCPTGEWKAVAQQVPGGDAQRVDGNTSLGGTPAATIMKVNTPGDAQQYPECRLDADKFGTPNPAPQGRRLEFEIHLKNSGDGVLQAVSVLDRLARIDYSEPTTQTTKGTCSTDKGITSWDIDCSIGSLAPREEVGITVFTRGEHWEQLGEGVFGFATLGVENTADVYADGGHLQLVTFVEIIPYCQRSAAVQRAGAACGSGRNDSLRGSSGADILEGNGGNDRIAGGGGNDALYGGAGNDVLNGGPGNDFLLGESGTDRLSGGPGNDSIDALDGRRDTIACGPGVDAVLADARDVIGIDCDRVRIGRR